MPDDAYRNPVEKPANPNAIRDHLANERTLLAWVRSSIAIIALGFVVARFGLLIRELGPEAPRLTPVWLSTGFGVAIVACGAVLIALAALRHRATTRAIEHGDYRPDTSLILVLSAGTVVVAVLLAVYLLLTA